MLVWSRPQIQAIIKQNTKQADISPKMLTTKILSAQFKKSGTPFYFDLVTKH